MLTYFYCTSVAAIIFGMGLTGQSPNPVSCGGTVQPENKVVQGQKLGPLPGRKVIGVLTSDVKEALAANGRVVPAGVVGFSSGLGGYRLVYIACPDKGAGAADISLPVGTAPGNQKKFDGLCLVTVDHLKPLGIDPDPYALVTIGEVNDGLGSPVDGDKIKASQIQVLDAARDYPLRVTDVVRDLNRQYKAYLEKQQSTIETLMKQTAAEVLEKRPVTGPRETKEQVFVTWLPGGERLRVEFRACVSDGNFSYGKAIVQGGAGRQQLPPTSDKRGVRFGTMFGIRLGMIYETSKDGNLVRSEPIGIESFHLEIPPPRLAR